MKRLFLDTSFLLRKHGPEGVRNLLSNFRLASL